MDNTGKMFTQVASAARVSEQQATIACYMLNLAKDGRSLNDAAALLRLSRAEARDHARSWTISFADYDATAPKPLALEWKKERRGRWILTVDGGVIACAESDGEGGYRARREGSAQWLWTGSSAAVAIKRASREIERGSLDALGVDDVTIHGPDAAGNTALLAPMDIGPRSQLRAALHH